jgi:hypothetical protein
MASEYPQIDEISRLEKKLMADINDFNTKYSCYLHSTNNPNKNTKYITSNQSSSCQPVTLNNVRSAKELVTQDIDNLNNAIANYRENNQTTYNVNFNELISKYNDVLNERRDLDTKLAELYGKEDGINNYYNNKYAATMFSKIMLTILVTSLVYYTFRKLIKK